MCPEDGWISPYAIPFAKTAKEFEEMTNLIWDGSAYSSYKKAIVPDPPPSFEERVDRCADMGIVVCLCSSVDKDGQRVMLYNPACKVHGRAK